MTLEGNAKRHEQQNEKSCMRKEGAPNTAIPEWVYVRDSTDRSKSRFAMNETMAVSVEGLLWKTKSDLHLRFVCAHACVGKTNCGSRDVTSGKNTSLDFFFH
tara:strand:- start:5792 stop:6097 length:306 start_codon:yes stop_codon:yes gene_type:complete